MLASRRQSANCECRKAWLRLPGSFDMQEQDIKSKVPLQPREKPISSIIPPRHLLAHHHEGYKHFSSPQLSTWHPYHFRRWYYRKLFWKNNYVAVLRKSTGRNIETPRKSFSPELIESVSLNSVVKRASGVPLISGYVQKNLTLLITTVIFNMSTLATTDGRRGQAKLGHAHKLGL